MYSRIYTYPMTTPLRWRNIARAFPSKNDESSKFGPKMFLKISGLVIRLILASFLSTSSPSPAPQLDFFLSCKFSQHGASHVYHQDDLGAMPKTNTCQG